MTHDASSDAPLVDSHAHVYTTDMPLSPTAWHKPPADATIDQYITTPEYTKFFRRVRDPKLHTGLEP